MRRWLYRTIHFNQLRLEGWVADQASRVPAGKRVLDVGAGGGPYRDLFAHCEYRTQDFGQAPEEIIQGEYTAIDYVSDITAIPVPDASFDVILNTEVLEHVPEPIAALREMARILAPGGRLILTTPLGSGIHMAPYHFYGGYTPFFFDYFLKQLGFVDISIQARGGSFAHLAQWMVWFSKRGNPLQLPMSVLKRAAMMPLYLAQLPAVGLMFFYARAVDRYDTERQFTGGYLVTALKATDAS